MIVQECTGEISVFDLLGLHGGKSVYHRHYPRVQTEISNDAILGCRNSLFIRLCQPIIG